MYKPYCMFYVFGVWLNTGPVLRACKVFEVLLIFHLYCALEVIFGLLAHDTTSPRCPQF